MSVEDPRGLPTEPPSHVPIPDPTSLTTKALEREIGHLRELMEAAQEQTSKHLDAADLQADARFKIQLEDVRRQVEAKFIEQDKAVQAALVSSDKAINELGVATTQRIEALQHLNEAQFITYRTLLDSQADKVKIAVEADNKLVTAAFAASKEAIRAAFDSSKEAIQKAETFNEKRFELMSKQLDELKTQLTLISGKGQGVAALWGYAIGAAGLIATVLAIVLAISNSNGA